MHAVKASIRLVCIDFDGTAVDYDGEHAFIHPLMADLLNRLPERKIRWCVNSGRSVDDQRRIIRLSQARGLEHPPCALLCSEAFIFREDRGEYVSSEPWNSHAWILLRRFHERVQRAIAPRLEDWKERYTPDVRIGEGFTVFCVSTEDGGADRFSAELAAAVSGIPHMEITRNGGWVVVLPDQLGKGNVLKHFYREIRGSRESTLAIGDHLNDVSMLNGKAAKWVGCPGDAEPAVLETVRGAGGHVASVAGPEGTAEVIRRLVFENA
ncbi:MAG: haloacid dehalogenase-like hydrolase [Verrucomicrobia bacterium ADurb.Bin345]|nr:MAG: haloacid dehalogenase-like hydrolase [Verrucomicrobia bacterium ADurb.Bin345]